MDASLSALQPDFLAYPEKFPSAKRDKYTKRIILQLAGERVQEHWSGTLMVKSGEQYFDVEEIKPTHFDRTPNRPRMIATPADTTLGLPQAIT